MCESAFILCIGGFTFCNVYASVRCRVFTHLKCVTTSILLSNEEVLDIGNGLNECLASDTTEGKPAAHRTQDNT